VNGEPALPPRWQVVLDRMFAELRSGSPRAEAYWAQQLAFGPVFFFAVALAVRRGAVRPEDLERLRQLVPLALSLLGALPDDGDATCLLLLARRQAAALALGRRQYLVRLASRLGLEMPKSPYDPVPGRLLRPYELIGWRPPRLGTEPQVEGTTSAARRSPD
jgi:hypothetical protein